jgi:hypothetical protein
MQDRKTDSVSSAAAPSGALSFDVLSWGDGDDPVTAPVSLDVSPILIIAPVFRNEEKGQANEPSFD